MSLVILKHKIWGNNSEYLFYKVSTLYSTTGLAVFFYRLIATLQVLFLYRFYFSESVIRHRLLYCDGVSPVHSRNHLVKNVGEVKFSL